MPRKKITLPDHVKRAVLHEIHMDHQASQAAVDREHLRIYLAVEQNVLQAEIADELGVTQQAISNWRKRGEQIARDRGLVSGPDGPGEREPAA